MACEDHRNFAVTPNRRPWPLKDPLDFGLLSSAASIWELTRRFLVY
jgi:hypothetical protein